MYYKGFDILLEKNDYVALAESFMGDSDIPFPNYTDNYEENEKCRIKYEYMKYVLKKLEKRTILLAGINSKYKMADALQILIEGYIV